jgi:hypothetical protein
MPMRIPIAADTANLGASQVSLAELESSEYTSFVPLSWRGGATARIIWICCGSQPAGASMDFDPSSGRIVRYRHDPNGPFILSSDEIKATLEDKTGTFWK